MTSAHEKAIAVSGMVTVRPGSRICQKESIKSSASAVLMKNLMVGRRKVFFGVF